MNALNVIFVTVATGIAAVGVYLAFLPGIAAVQTNSAVENIQILAQILKTAELQGIPRTDRDDSDEFKHLLTGWTQGGDAIDATDADKLDSVSGQDTIQLNEGTPRGGFRISVESDDVCEGVKRVLEARENPVFGVLGCEVATGTAPYAAHTVTSTPSNHPANAPATRVLAVYLR